MPALEPVSMTLPWPGEQPAVKDISAVVTVTGEQPAVKDISAMHWGGRVPWV
jgi:hypothetical protein